MIPVKPGLNSGRMITTPSARTGFPFSVSFDSSSIFDSSHRSHNSIPLFLMYITPSLHKLGATLMYATGSPSNVHFLAAQPSLSSERLFVGEASPTVVGWRLITTPFHRPEKIRAFAASNVAQDSCACWCRMCVFSNCCLNTREINTFIQAYLGLRMLLGFQN